MIQAIETVYKGYRFRSRAEARWAVFFDALGLEWEYEKEGYALEDGAWYLPDFWLPKLDIWVEIKPLETDANGYAKWSDDTAKQDLLAEASGKTVVTLCGTPGLTQPGTRNPSYEGVITGDNSYYWCECPVCGALGIQFEGRSARNQHLPGCKATTGDKGYNWDSPRLTAAYAAARSARFEHGETPHV